jgi:WD40 repeat protein
MPAVSVRGAVSSAFRPPLDSGVLILWDATTGRRMVNLVSHRSPPISLDFSLDGRTLASCGNPFVRRWDVVTGRGKLYLATRGDRIDFVRFTPDDRTIVVKNCEGISSISTENQEVVATYNSSKVAPTVR